MAIFATVIKVLTLILSQNLRPNQGYRQWVFSCLDVDECKRGHRCDQNAECLNLAGSYDCTCSEGHRGNGFECSNICEGNGELCHENGACRYNGSAHNCECNKGYKGAGTQCTDIDECLDFEVSCPSEQNRECSNVDGGFLCDCLGGFESSQGADNCTDIDECSTGECHLEQAICLNYPGSFDCSCLEGKS